MEPAFRTAAYSFRAMCLLNFHSKDFSTLLLNLDTEFENQTNNQKTKSN